MRYLLPILVLLLTGCMNDAPETIYRLEVRNDNRVEVNKQRVGPDEYTYHVYTRRHESDGITNAVEDDSCWVSEETYRGLSVGDRFNCHRRR